MDTKNVIKTEKIMWKRHLKRETHVSNTTKNRTNEKNVRIFSLFNLLFFNIFHSISLFNFLFFHIFHIFSLFNLPFFQFRVFILTMSFSSALIVYFASTYSCRFRVFILTMSFSSAFIVCFARPYSCWFRMFIRKLSVLQVHIVVSSEYLFWPWILADKSH